MSTLSSTRGRSAALLLTLAVVGCVKQDGEIDTLPRRAISGTVSLGSKPLAGGTIQFDPVADTKGVSVSTAVKDGKFAIDQPMGPAPGKYRVRISSRKYLEIKADEIPGGPTKPETETIPEQYNRKTKLEAEVTADGPNSFEFALGK